MADVPTIAEAGFASFDVNPWWGILGPAGLSPDIVAKINADIAELLTAPDLLDVLAKQGASALKSSPAEFGSRLQADIGKWANVVKASGARIN